ncbi:hypothetical protein [Falsiroseomonas sp. CW058]|uniref:hypothetical protein n=1 Tax=Falsiroseomonas sp. CW058 TaxID=3388664 RepID=UPI003D323517
MIRPLARLAGRLPWRARAALPQDGRQRTALKAVVAAALLLGGLTLLAHACSGGWATRPEMERFTRLGPRQGPATLERELLAAFPPGSDVGPVFARLERLGFDCGAALDPTRGGACRFRARREDGRVASMVLEVSHDGLRLRGLAARMSIEAPRRD